jgi:polyhydroxyalkanoate synthesis repressor PhaR
MSQNETQKIKVVKRYANRKLYDTETSQYVTLGDIRGFIKDGREVIVIDNRSKRDITANTLWMSLIETAADRDDLSTSQPIELIKNGLVTKTASGTVADLVETGVFENSKTIVD